MRSAVIRLGDPGHDPAALDKHMQGLAEALARDCSADDKFQTAAIDTILECAAHFPAKGGIYAVVVALVNLDNKEFAPQLMEKLNMHIKNAFESYQPAHPKTRLLVCN
jgi:hypothetical protein